MWCSPGVPWGFFIHRNWDSPAPPLPPRPDEASPAAAPPPPRPGPSSLRELRNSTQPGPSPLRNQRFASKNVLVHETLPAIALMTVASLEITHISDSPLASVVHRPWRQTTDGDSLQEIPLLLCVSRSYRPSTEIHFRRFPFYDDVGVRPVPPLMMTTLGNPHHSLLLGKPHHRLMGNLHQGNPHHSVLLGNPHHHLENLHHSLLQGNPRHGLLLGNPRHGFWRISITIFPWGIPVTVFSGGIPIIFGNHHHGLLLPLFGRWWISFSRHFLIIRLLLPIHNRDHSIFYYLDVAEAIPQQERFARHIKHGKACHTLFSILSTSLKGSQIRPLRGRN